MDCYIISPETRTAYEIEEYTYDVICNTGTAKPLPPDEAFEDWGFDYVLIMNDEEAVWWQRWELRNSVIDYKVRNSDKSTRMLVLNAIWDGLPDYGMAQRNAYEVLGLEYREDEVPEYKRSMIRGGKDD